MKYKPKIPSMSSYGPTNEVSKMFVLKGDLLAAIVGNQVAQNVKEQIFDESRKIDQNTKLLDVLAEEIELQGTAADVDINGFQEITGLNFTRKDSKASNRAGTTGSKPNSAANQPAEMTGTLSAIVNKMPVAPGVVLKEF